jgi:hypothetical protein
MSPALVQAASPDPVLEWNTIMNATVLAGGTTPLVTTRVVTHVAAAVFDAVNGIERRYGAIHVRPAGPRHASARAAAIQAAYVTLVAFYPAQTASLTAQRDASIAVLYESEDPRAIAAGVAWGQTVADAILEWRTADGFAPPPPPFLGVLGIVGTPAAIGVWRPTPLADGSQGASGAGPQFASMTPWVLTRPSQFRPGPPPELTSEEYTTDYEELRTMGVYDGSLRTPDQSELALFWAGNTPLYWNRIANQLATTSAFGLVENAHLFALLNLAMGDATIACWDAKYRYVFWRPITAIQTMDDPAWKPWLDFFPAGTPAHPEYVSGHSTVSSAAAFVLASIFGDDTAFTIDSDVQPGTRSFPSFSAAVAEIVDARVFGGIHFRTSCMRGNAVGRGVADYVSQHAIRARDDDGGDQR